MSKLAHRPPLEPESVAALREAGLAGPGFKGRRTFLTRPELAKLARRLEALGVEPPGHLTDPREWIDRPARLFEAGEYPDKGLTVTPQDLETLAQAFDHPVPILIEHAKSPLELGYLTDVRAEGPVLMGTVSLTKEANDLIETSGARSLSLGLSPGMDRILEVSLVRDPRVKSAQMFCDGGLLCEGSGTDDGFVERCLREGKLTPAQRPVAEALLAGVAAAWSQGQPASALVRRLIELNPSRGLFAETVPDVRSEEPWDAEVRDFYRRHFPGLSLEEIAKRADP